MHYELIANPHAGGGTCGQRLDSVVERLRNSGLDIKVHLTERPGHATEIAADIWAAGFRRILIVGGDGTTFEVLNGLTFSPDDRAVLGMIPLGTGNSYLRDFGITDSEQAIAAILRGNTQPSDVVCATTDKGAIYYINLLSIGFTADVGAMTNQWFKPLGAGGYAVATVLSLAKLQPKVFPITVDGTEDSRPADFLSFSNSRYTGGTMMMAPEANVADGELDIIRIGDLGRVGLLKAFPGIYKGVHLENPLNESRRASRVDLHIPSQALMIDGEIVHAQLQRLEVLPSAVEVIA